MIANVKQLTILLLCLVFAIAAVPASAGTILYNNITPTTPSVSGSYNVGAAEIDYGYSITNSFTLSNASMLDSAVVGLWVKRPSTVTSLD